MPFVGFPFVSSDLNFDLNFLKFGHLLELYMGLVSLTSVCSVLSRCDGITGLVVLSCIKTSAISNSCQNSRRQPRFSGCTVSLSVGLGSRFAESYLQASPPPSVSR